jgi:hypothetical protein
MGLSLALLAYKRCRLGVFFSSIFRQHACLPPALLSLVVNIFVPYFEHFFFN